MEGCLWSLCALVPHLISVCLEFVRSRQQHTGVEQTKRQHRQNNHGTIKHVCSIVSALRPVTLSSQCMGVEV